MTDINIGTRLKRKFSDYATVKVIDIVPGSEHILIKDATGTHFVKISDIDTHFSVVSEKEPEAQTAIEAHSIANTMNDPSSMQKKAFDKDNE